MKLLGELVAATVTAVVLAALVVPIILDAFGGMA